MLVNLSTVACLKQRARDYAGDVRWSDGESERWHMLDRSRVTCMRPKIDLESALIRQNASGFY